MFPATDNHDHCDGPPRRPRVLLMAYACGPHHGSEPGAGWRRALSAASCCDTWVICEEHEFAEVIRHHERTEGIPSGLRFVFVPKHPWEVRLGRLPGLYYLTYDIWQRRAAGVARRLHDELHFDLVHQVNICGYRAPGYLWRLGVPFVWGPVGGTQNFPWRFLGSIGLRGALQEATRNVLNSLQLRFSRRVRQAAQHARALIAANSEIQRELATRLGVSPLVQCDVGLDALKQKPAADAGASLRILWCGNLLPFKALPVLLRALATLPPQTPYEVRVVGAGPCRESWGRLASRLGLAKKVAFLGRLPHAEALKQYGWADVFAFTSLRDTTGTVVMEALAAGLPVLCFDHQGVGDVVTPQCGIKVAPRAPAHAIQQFADAIERLATDRALLTRLGQGARARAADYLWSRLGPGMIEIYRSILGDEWEWTPRSEEPSISSVGAALRSQVAEVAP